MHIPFTLPAELSARIALYQPAGRFAAMRRGQSPDKYADDYRKGLKPEVAVRLATGMTIEPVFAPSSGHAPDVVWQGAPVSIKTASTYGGSVSWIFEVNDTDERLVMLFGESEPDWWVAPGPKVAVVVAVVLRSEIQPLLKSLRRPLPTKQALYQEDLP